MLPSNCASNEQIEQKCARAGQRKYRDAIIESAGDPPAPNWKQSRNGVE